MTSSECMIALSGCRADARQKESHLSRCMAGDRNKEMKHREELSTIERNLSNVTSSLIMCRENASFNEGGLYEHSGILQGLQSKKACECKAPNHRLKSMEKYLSEIRMKQNESDVAARYYRGPLDRCMVASQAEHRWLQLKLAAVQTQLRKSATRSTWQEKEMRSQKALLEIARQSLIRLDTRNARIVGTLRQCKVTSRDLRRRVREEREICMERTGGYRLSPDNNMLVHPRNAFRYSAGRVYYEH